MPGLDPPRYCPQCGAWLAVAVTPGRWEARCHSHGTLGPVPERPAAAPPADGAGPAGGAGAPEVASARSRVESIPKFNTDRSHYGPALRDWMARRFPDRSDVAVTSIDIPVATGFSNETVMFDVAWTEGGQPRTERYVGRVEPPDGGVFPVQTPQCAVSVEMQYRTMEAVAAAGAAPMPPLVGYEPDPAVLGQPFYVMGFVEGRVPSDNPRYSESGFVVDEATPAQRQTMVQSGLEAMARVHSIDWRAAGLGWLDASGCGAPDQAVQIDLYRRGAAEALAGRDHPVLDAALDWLAANDPGDDRVGLSWGDARIGNIIWRDYRPAAVCDWEAAALCPTEADLGWWLMFDRMVFDSPGLPRPDGYPDRAEMIAHYEAASGRACRHSDYWETFAVMRFCAIFIRIGDRMAQSGLLGEGVNPAVGNLATAALAERLGIDNPTPDLLVPRPR